MKSIFIAFILFLAQIHADDYLDSAIAVANKRVEDWLITKSAGIAAKVIYGPNMDGTYFYRLGPQGPWDTYAYGKKLAQKKNELLQKGFPLAQPQEMFLLNLTNNKARAIANPTILRCAKHFPGGDEQIEVTEATAVRFTDKTKVNLYLQPFLQVLKSNYSPPCMMLGHAMYPQQAFQAEETQFLGPLFGWQKFSDLPASLNPGVMGFLYKNLNYKGVTITDWLNMASVNDFLKPVSDKYGLTIAALYAASYANVDFVAGLPSGDMEDLVEKINNKLPADVVQEWDLQLSNWLVDFVSRVGAGKIAFDLSSAKEVSFKAKIALKFSSTQGYTDEKILAKEFSSEFLDEVKKYWGGTDVWNRTGVLVLLQRQFIISELSKKEWPVPTTIADETTWFNQLMSDKDFMAEYKKIDWNSSQVQEAFARFRMSNF